MHDYDLVAFSGGGIRCFWHGGFLSCLESRTALRPDFVTGVSGGALSASAWLADREMMLKDLMIEAFTVNEANLSASDGRIETPHQDLYRAVVSTLIDDAAESQIANGPRFEILLSSPPAMMPGAIATLFYGALYKVDEAIRSDPRLVLPGKFGLEAIVVDAREAARMGRLVDLVCAAASIPPVFEMAWWDGKRVMDGAMASKVHLPRDFQGKALVLLTKQYGGLVGDGDRTFVSPGSEVPADKIDFTEPDKIGQTWRQGEADARAWMSSGQ